MQLTCTGCIEGKTTKATHKRAHRATDIGQSIFSDVCGPFKPKARTGHLYFMTIVDTASRYAWVHSLTSRSEVPSELTTALQIIANHTDKYPHTLTTDNAKEYTCRYVQKFLMSRGTQYRPTTPYKPQENSIAERINRTIMNSVRTSLSHSHLPTGYWKDAVQNAVFTFNLTYHHSVGNIPYTLWHGAPPRLHNLFIFGQLGSAPVLHAPNTFKPKLETRAYQAWYTH